MANRTTWTPKKEEKFLLVLIDTGGNVSAACLQAGVARSTAYKHRDEKAEFAKQWNEAVEAGTDDLEQEARRRAFEGTVEPIFYKGAECGGVRKYSDTLMIFLLKGNRPEKYKDRHEIDHAGTIEHKHTIDLSGLSDDDLVKLRQINQKLNAA